MDASGTTGFAPLKLTHMNNTLWRSGSETINGFRMHYRDWRPRDEASLPVLALHGSLSQSGAWIALAQTAKTIRMLCPDQRGFGLSEDPGSDACGEFAADALALAQRLLPPRFVVMGHSFACSIALEAARIATDKTAAVVLVDPVVRLPTASPTAVPPPLVLPESFATLEDAVRYFRESEEGDWPGDTLERFVADIMLRDDATGTWRFPYTPARLRRLRAFTASPASDYDLFAKAKAVRCPVLIFRGGASKRFPAAAEAPFVQAFPAKPAVVLCPTSGHFPTASETGIVADGLLRFLAARR
jgi:esterase